MTTAKKAKAEKKENTDNVVDAEFTPAKTAKKSTALVPVQRTEPDQLIRLAVEKDLDVEKLEKLLQLQERWQKEQARIAFFEALAHFQSIVPEIPKSKNVTYRTEKGTTSYNYAPLGEIDKTIKEAMKECGLSKRWEFKTQDGCIECTCVVSHSAGHSERTTMVAGFDTSGGKNSIQSRGSAMTYLQRYTFIGAVGISTADEDNDGNSDDDDQRERERPEPRRQSSDKPAEQSQKPKGEQVDRQAMLETYRTVIDKLKAVGYDTASNVAGYASQNGFGPVKKLGDIPTDKLKGLTDHLKAELLKATAKPAAKAEPKPEPSEDPEDEESDSAEDGDVKLTHKLPLKAQWKAMATMCEALKDHHAYRSNGELLTRINGILGLDDPNDYLTDIADVDKADVGKVMNALSAELVEAKKGKK